jgi:hypothetical protein
MSLQFSAAVVRMPTRFRSTICSQPALPQHIDKHAGYGSQLHFEFEAIMTALHRVALLGAVALALGAMIAPGPAEANPAPRPKAAAAKPAKIKTDTRVYLLRGLLNVFSFGMDDLAKRLNAMGIEAEVDNHNAWLSIANKIAEDHRRGSSRAAVVIGHSLGADVLFQLAERLDRENVPVRLAVFFDPTISHDVSKNVEHVLNLYQLNGFGRKVTAPKGYKGELVNMDLSGDTSIGHGSIDKSEKLHDLVIAKIMKVAVQPAKRKRPVPAASQPATGAGRGAAVPAVPASIGPTPAAQAPR